MCRLRDWSSHLQQGVAAGEGLRGGKRAETKWMKKTTRESLPGPVCVHVAFVWSRRRRRHTCQLRKARRSPVQRRAQRREAAAAEGRSERPPAPSSKGGRGPLRSHHLTHATRCWCGTPTPPWTRPQSRARGASRAAPSPAGSEGGGRASTGEPKRGHRPHFFGCGFAQVQDGNDSARLFITSLGSSLSRICRSDKEGV